MQDKAKTMAFDSVPIGVTSRDASIHPSDIDGHAWLSPVTHGRAGVPATVPYERTPRRRGDSMSHDKRDDDRFEESESAEARIAQSVRWDGESRILHTRFAQSERGDGESRARIALLEDEVVDDRMRITQLERDVADSRVQKAISDSTSQRVLRDLQALQSRTNQNDQELARLRVELAQTQRRLARVEVDLQDHKERSHAERAKLCEQQRTKFVALVEENENMRTWLSAQLDRLQQRERRADHRSGWVHAPGS